MPVWSIRIAAKLLMPVLKYSRACRAAADGPEMVMSRARLTLPEKVAIR